MSEDFFSTPRVFIRYGIARKQSLLKDVRRAFDGIVLPGNVLLYQYNSTPSVIMNCNLPYFVDPMSYLFGQPYEDFKRRTKKGNRYKPSFIKLLKGHGLSDNHLRLQHSELMKLLLDDPQIMHSFVENALNFQQSSVYESLKTNREMISPQNLPRLDDGSLYPTFYVPPYFLFSTGNNGHGTATDLNRAIIEYCWGNREHWSPIFPLAFVHKRQLESTIALDSIISDLKNHDFPGYCVWIDDFDEKRATEPQIAGFIRLIKSLAFPNSRVVIMHAGYFSLVLHQFGVSGICHGLAYGEALSATAAARRGSGGPPIRYYLKDLHHFLTLPDALLVLRKRPDLICTCPICMRIVRGDAENVIRFENEEALAEMHFLFNRDIEKRDVAKKSIRDLLNYLTISEMLYNDIGELKKEVKINEKYQERSIIDPQYLNRWITAITNALPAET